MPILDINPPRAVRRRGPAVALSVAALVVVACVAAAGHREEPEDVPPEAAAWHGAMSLYRTIAVWAGHRALSAEMNYWKATTR